MGRRDLAGRLDGAERRLAPADGWTVWLPVDDRDDVVRNAATGEMLMPADLARRVGRHILVEYVDGEPPCG